MVTRRKPKDTIWKFVTIVTKGIKKIYRVPNFKAMRNKLRKK